MKNIVIEYFNILAYIITGIVFSIASFLIIINIYHYKNVNEVYKTQDSNYEIKDNLKYKLDNIKSNINNLPSSTNPNFIAYSKIQTKLNICYEKIDIEQFDKLLTKTDISISDVYNMQQFYKLNIANECLIKQLYTLVDDEDNSINNLASFNLVKPFIKNNIDQLKESSDYIEKVIKSNSSYKFTNDFTKSSIYDEVKDSYYKIINDYNNSIDFIYDISIWYKNEVGENT